LDVVKCPATCLPIGRGAHDRIEVFAVGCALSPITARMRELMNDHSTLDAILKDGAARARAIAQPILDATMQRVGFLKV
jgi:hypothetical protein